MYKEYSPDARLVDLVETYWVYDSIIMDPVPQTIMPDGCVDIIFDFINNDGSGRLQSGLPELVGTMTSVLKINYKIGPVQMLGIRFRPAGITAFIKMPVYEITNRTITLSLANTIFNREFFESLPDMQTMQQRLKHIDNYLLGKMNKVFKPERQIQYAVELIRENNGLIPVRKIAEEVCLSERHFERKFKASIGISPKLFNNIMRFQFARHYLKKHKDESIYTVAISCGYHDHSHMNKEFQRLGSISPSDLII